MRKIIIFLIYCWGGLSLYGQTLNPSGNSVSEDSQLPKVLLPSPQAMTFMRYGQIPVSLSTGVPEISIPIYTIQTHGLELPINISYHASGIKVKDISGTIGLGWVLNAGGMIAQTVYSWNDDDKEFEHKLENLPFHTAVEAKTMLGEEARKNRSSSLGGVVGPINLMWYGCTMGYAAFSKKQPYYPEPRNTISDRYQFNFNGTSGIFRYNLQTQQYEMVPFSTMQIKPISNNRGFIITDEKGIKWSFGFIVETRIKYSSENAIPAKEYYLTAIEIPGEEDPITFSYTKGKPYEITTWSESIFTGKKAKFDYTDRAINSYTVEYIFEDHQDERTYVPQTTISEPAILNSIKWKDVNIAFSYKESIANQQLKEQLKSISIKSGAKEIRKVELEQGLINSRMFLNKVTVNDEEYTFDYDRTNLPLYNPAQFSEDFWGYYNNANSAWRLIPFKWTSPYQRDYLKFREAKPTYSQAGILKTIIYPTKGYTVFEYEQNKGHNVFNKMKTSNPNDLIYVPDESLGIIVSDEEYFGGLRIKKITNYDRHGQANWKRYEYKGGPTLTIYPDYFCVRKLQYYFPINPKNGSILNTLGNPAITEAEMGFGGYAPSSDIGASAFYNRVVEYHGHDAVYEGKIEYDFEQDADTYCAATNSPQYESLLNHCDKGILTPLLVSKKEYINKDGSYILKQQNENYYHKINKGYFIVGIDISHNYVFTPSLHTLYELDFLRDFYDLYYNNFNFSDIVAYKDFMQLDSSVTTEYTDNGNFSTKIQYEYDRNHYVLTPVATTTYGSVSGETYTERVTHPFHYNTTPYTTMNGRNIRTPIVSKISYKNEQPISSVFYKYKHIGSNSLFVVESVSMAKGNHQPEERIQYHKYDNYGNPLHITKDNITNIVYLWGYKGRYPVAEIKNATYEQVKTALLRSPEDLSTENAVNAAVKTLRNKLPQAQVTTFTYSPFGKVATLTDPNGVTTYYEYDDFGRLWRVLDHDGNILKQQEYHYHKD